MAEEVGKPLMVPGGQIEMTNFVSKRRLIRSAKNPMDRCTIVSIFPKEIIEFKYTIEPGRFVIPKGSYEDPGILTIGSSSWWKDYDVEQPMLEIPVNSIQLADSIIKDYSNGMLGCNMSDCMPGLFFVLGEQTKLQIQANFKEKLKDAKTKQDNWYRVLVRLADSLWARTGGNPLAIWEEMKVAAIALNENDKPWLKSHQIAEMERCVACGTLKNPAYPVCPACKAIDSAHPLAKDLKFAV